MRFFIRIMNFIRRIWLRLVISGVSTLLSFLSPKTIVNIAKNLPFYWLNKLLAPSFIVALYHHQVIVGAKDFVMQLHARFKTPWTSLLTASAFLRLNMLTETKGIVTEAFSTYDVGSKRNIELEDLADIETIIDIELDKISDDAVQSIVIGRGRIADEYYARAWRYHSMQIGGEVARAVKVYCAAMDYDAASCVYACEKLLRPNGLFKEIEEILIEVENTMDRKEKYRIQKLTKNEKAAKISILANIVALRGFCLLHSKKTEEAQNLIKENAKLGNAVNLFSTFYYYQNDDYEGLKTALRRGISGQKITTETRDNIAEAYFWAGMCAEGKGLIDEAKEYYKRSTQIGQINFYFPESSWRYVSVLTYMNEWGLATSLLRRGWTVIWNNYRKFAKMTPYKRFKLKRFVPKNGALVFGGQGVGDEIFRLAILRELMPKSKKFGYTVDKRLAPLFERAIPNLKAYSPSTTRGIHAVSEKEYWEDRDGVPFGMDLSRVNLEIMKDIKKYRDIMLSEDLMFAYFVQGGKFRGRKEPLFEPLESETNRVRNWLDTLPNKIKVGISWRSGELAAFRDVCYTKIEQWGPILKNKKIDFILLQYTNHIEDLERELAQAKQLFGCEIHTMPNFDLKNDFETMVAMCRALDIVIAPGTALRETAGAAGANCWTLSTTPVTPDQWRIDQEDEHTDLVFPSMYHFSAKKYKNADNAIMEIGKRLDEMTAKLDSETI